MMNKQFSQKIYIGLALTVLGIGLFLANPVFALEIPPDLPQDNLVVEYWSETENNWLPLKGPIFSETNFLPGQGITRLVRVTNKSGEIKRIAAEVINVKDLNRLGDVLNLEIKEGGTRLYNNALSKFFTEGEVYLSNLAGGGVQTQYDFIVTFYSGTGNPFQGKSLSFDILVGFQGEEGGILPGAGGGVGGYLPPGLTIPEESVRIIVTETSVTIEWITSYPATSQVIYAKDGESHTLCLTQTEGCALGAPPKYGYERTTPEDLLKIISHSVTITGLDSNTKYYHRTISHASLAISQEHSFTTLGAKEGGEEIVEEEGLAGESPVGEITEETGAGREIVKGGEVMVGKGGGSGGAGEGDKKEEVAGEKEKPKEGEKTGMNFDKLSAAIGNFFTLKNLGWLFLFFVIILTVLFVLSVRKKGERKNK